MPVLSFYVHTYTEGRTRNQDRGATFKNLAKYTPFLHASSQGTEEKAERKGEESSAQLLASPKGDANSTPPPKNWRASFITKLSHKICKAFWDHANFKDFL